MSAIDLSSKGVHALYVCMNACNACILNAHFGQYLAEYLVIVARLPDLRGLAEQAVDIFEGGAKLFAGWIYFMDDIVLRRLADDDVAHFATEE